MSVRRNARFVSLLAPAVGLVMVAVVGLAPSAAAASINGPFIPGTSTIDTAQGHTVEWQVSESAGCSPTAATWYVSASGTGLSDVTANPTNGSGITAATTITATISGDVGSLAQLNVGILYTGLIYNPVDMSFTPCTNSTNSSANFTITAPPAPPVVTTTASLSYKKSLPGFTGKLTADEGCDAGRSVKLYKVDGGPDTKIDTKTSGEDGSYKFKGKAKNGKYYVKAPKVTREAVVCGGDTSPKVTVG